MQRPSVSLCRPFKHERSKWITNFIPRGFCPDKYVFVDLSKIETLQKLWVHHVPSLPASQPYPPHYHWIWQKIPQRPLWCGRHPKACSERLFSVLSLGWGEKSMGTYENHCFYLLSYPSHWGVAADSPSKQFGDAAKGWNADETLEISNKCGSFTTLRALLLNFLRGMWKNCHKKHKATWHILAYWGQFLCLYFFPGHWTAYTYFLVKPNHSQEE